MVAVLALLVAGGCGAAKRETVRPPSPSVGPKVAVAPMENRSNDLDASEIIRSAFAGEIAGRGWNVVPVEESDRMLRESLGISYGGQLRSTTPEEVCGALGVDGVFYGDVEEWNKTTTGIYNSVSVAAGFRLYRRDGSLAWQGADRQFRKNVPRGGGKEIGAEIVGHAIVNLLMNPMTPYGRTVGRNIAHKLPGGALHAPLASDNTIRGSGVAGQTDPAVTGGVK
ncbi:MAG: DUF799 family lipoprotein [Deltaproteobacteria bacterium]|nr:DUF799 family lipoprotein [Deltaproteobacteria bacterium]